MNELRLSQRFCHAVCLAGALHCLALAASADDAKPRVLILGDSISIGYTPLVAKALADEAIVRRPTTAAGKAENCEGTTKGVAEIDRWLAADGGHWDVIHFNFGLHDVKRVDPATRKNSNNPNHPRQAEPDQYREQLAAIAARLKNTGARLIFATTTPVPPGAGPLRDAADPPRYNAIAVEIMQQEKVPIDDLFGLANDRLPELQLPKNVHFNEHGSAVLAEAVVAEIRKAIAAGKQ